MKLILKFLMMVMVTSTMLSANTDLLQKTFMKKIDQVIEVVLDKNITKENRNGKIVTLLSPMFDFELMAKLSLGKKWKTINKEDRKQFVRLYVERMKKSYSAKFDAYEDEKVLISSVENT
jgi:phospholipid transport system substrate-binding protein